MVLWDQNGCGEERDWLQKELQYCIPCMAVVRRLWLADMTVEERKSLGEELKVPEARD